MNLQQQQSQQDKNNREKIIVHSMGKVGSSSITKSISFFLPNQHIYQTHMLNKEALDSHLNFLKRKGLKFHQHIHNSLNLRKDIDIKNHQQWKVITLTRDPIARNISAFFENIENICPGVLSKNINHVDISNLRNMFFDKYNHDIAINWFVREIVNVFDIDFSSFYFPKKQGYFIIQKPVQLLIIRIEDLNHCHQNAFQEFLGIDNFDLYKMNEAKSKKYKELYKKFHEGLIIPDEYIRRMYNSWYAQYFYTAEELKTFASKYSASSSISL